MSQRQRSRKHANGPGCRERGFTLIELLIVVVIVGLLAAIAIMNYTQAIAKARITRAIAELRTIEKEITKYQLDFEEYPADLAAIAWKHNDPWGHPYQYLPLDIAPRPGGGAGAGGGGAGGALGHARKDRWLVPLNTDFDLYSAGPDGKSRPPLTAKDSRDDIVRAGNGSYVGPASEF